MRSKGRLEETGVPAQLIDGKSISQEIIEEVKTRIAESGVVPHLVAIQAGEDPASMYYVRNQKKKAEAVGMRYTLRQLPGDASQGALIEEIHKLNDDPDVTGVILQMPLPEGVDRRAVQREIDYRKDVEGITPTSLGLILQDRPVMVPCTALGAVELLHRVMERTGDGIEGKNCVIVGRSEIVGKPVAMLMLSMSRSATVTVCHSRTRNLNEVIGGADVLFAAVGRPMLIKGDWIRDGAVVIDVGINRIPMTDEQGNPVLNEKGRQRYRTVGDVEFEAAKDRAAWITPVPGGVGPMTTAILMRNTFEAAERLKSG